MELNSVIQKNAEISETMASMAKELNDQSAIMADSVSFFKVSSNDADENIENTQDEVLKLT